MIVPVEATSMRFKVALIVENRRPVAAGALLLLQILQFLLEVLHALVRRESTKAVWPLTSRMVAPAVPWPVA